MKKKTREETTKFGGEDEKEKNAEKKSENSNTNKVSDGYGRPTLK